MASETARGQNATDQAGPIAADLPCHVCGYDLRTLDRSGRCPECGQPVAASVEAWFKLEPPWLEQVAIGAGLLTVCLIGVTVLVLIGAIFAWTGARNPLLITPIFVVAPFVLAVGGLGVLFVTKPHPVRGQDERVFGRFSSRRLVRTCTAVLLLSLVGIMVANSIPGVGGVPVAMAVSLMGLSVSLVLWFPALALHFSALLRHVHASAWERRARLRLCFWGIMVAEVLGVAAVVWSAGGLPGVRAPAGALAKAPLLVPVVVLVALATLTGGGCRVLNRIQLLRAVAGGQVGLENPVAPEQLQVVGRSGGALGAIWFGLVVAAAVALLIAASGIAVLLAAVLVGVGLVLSLRLTRAEPRRAGRWFSSRRVARYCPVIVLVCVAAVGLLRRITGAAPLFTWPLAQGLVWSFAAALPLVLVRYISGLLRRASGDGGLLLFGSILFWVGLCWAATTCWLAFSPLVILCGAGTLCVLLATAVFLIRAGRTLSNVISRRQENRHFGASSAHGLPPMSAGGSSGDELPH